jgi:hypothetical protein
MAMGYVPCDPERWTCALEVYAYFALVGWPWTVAALFAVGGSVWLLRRICRASETQGDGE